MLATQSVEIKPNDETIIAENSHTLQDQRIEVPQHDTIALIGTNDHVLA